MMDLATLYNQGMASYIALCMSVLAGVYLICLVFYRLALHPLAKYPGPLLAKITDLYSVYHAWKGDRHIDFFLCHEKYGPIFRYGPNRVSFNTSTALHTIHFAKSNVRKSDFYSHIKPVFGHNILSVMNKHDHSRKRRAIAHAFSEKALKSYEEDMIGHIRTFCGKLKGSGGAVNMSEWCAYLTCDVLGDLCFGQSFAMLEREEHRFVGKVMTESASLAMITGCTIDLGKFGVQRAFFSDLLKGRLRFRAFVLKQAAARASIPASQGRRDFYHNLVESKSSNTDEKFSDQEFWSEANNLIAAGTDTLSSTLAATFFYLTHNESCLEKVTREVREAFKGQDIEKVRPGTALGNCRYLRACLDESMRLTPPVPGILPRKVLRGGFEIDGYFLAEGTEIGVCAYAIHHNPTYFSKPFEYRPERFLGDNEEKMDAYAPFSLGPRGCVGKNLAYMEMMVTMARVLVMFDMKVVGTLGEGRPGGEAGRRRKGEFQVKDCFVSLKDGPMIEFKCVE